MNTPTVDERRLLGVNRMRDRIMSALVGGIIGGLVATAIGSYGFWASAAAQQTAQIPSGVGRFDDAERGVVCYYLVGQSISCMKR